MATHRDPRGDETRGSLASVGLVGCGRMGRAIGEHLLEAGWTLTVTDVDPESVQALVVRGASPADDPRGVADASDLVLVVVVDDDQVRRVIGGPGGVIDGARPGTVIAICSSVRPDTCRSSAEAGETRDVEVIDVALVRGERGAEAGELLLLCGGPGATIDRCRPVFAAFATDVVRVGDIGTGQVAKTANNILLWACLRADLEALRLGRALGVEPTVLRSVLALGSGANRPLAEWGEHRLRWHAKDLEVAAALAEEAGVDASLIEALGPLMADVRVEDLRELL